MHDRADVLLVGAGAAGVAAAIWAARSRPGSQVLLLEGARKIGAKILVSGGGRCNVTHHAVDEKAFAGSTPAAIRKVLRRFDVAATIRLFQEQGVELKREETGKLFPTTDDSRMVLNALLGAARQAGVRLENPRRVNVISRTEEGFRVAGDWGEREAQRVVLATGGKSLPKSGSDGYGFELARALGHSVTPRLLPALVPLLLPEGHFLRGLSGLTLRASLTVETGTGRRIISFTDSTLCTHFGLSGPSVLNISRYFLFARLDDPDTRLIVNWLPGRTSEEVDRELRELGKTKVINQIRRLLPDRLADSLVEHSGVASGVQGHQLTRTQRGELVRALTRMELPVTGDRGFNTAEVTAGGIPLAELNLQTMESRVCPGLFICGEMCDVDGRIGGFNFQWAWASGYVAGVGAACNS